MGLTWGLSMLTHSDGAVGQAGSTPVTGKDSRLKVNFKALIIGRPQLTSTIPFVHIQLPDLSDPTGRDLLHIPRSCFKQKGDRAFAAAAPRL